MHVCSGTRGTGQQVLCVRGNASAGGTGTAAQPFNTIGTAVSQARNGDIIQVAGKESPTSQMAYRESIVIGNYQNSCDNGGTQKNIVFLGGFNEYFSDRNADQYPTIVIGSSANPAFLVCVMRGTTIIDGFSITSENNNRGIYGLVGGYNNEPGSFTISHNKLFDNRARNINDYTYGGGVHLEVMGGAQGEISDNHSFNNTSGRGSGISAFSGRRNGVWGNLLITRNRVENNVSRASHGGGMNISGSAEVSYNVVLNNELWGDDWGGFGAGFIVDGQSANAPVYAHHNVVMGNRPMRNGGYGGAGEFYDEDVVAVVEYSFVAGNGCVNEVRTSEIMVDGGNQGRSTVEFRNMTVINHTCPAMTYGAMLLQAQSTVTINNSIFWNNIGSGNQRRDFGAQSGNMSQFTVTNTTSGQSISGTGNSTDDPQFANPQTGRYHSQAFPNRGAFAPGGLNPNP